MQKDTMQESARARTQCLWVHGRSLWNEADASLSFDWPGTQICFRVRGSPTEVNMLASIGDDVLAVYANGRWQRKIGPSHGGRERYLLVRDAPADCTIRMVKLSEPNMSNPITIYDVWTGLYSLQDGVAPSICPLDISGDRPDAESTFECVGDSDTSALYNVAISDSATALDSNIEEGWPFFLAESLGVAPPMVVALSGVGVHAGPHRPESLSSYYQRLVCCWRHSQDSAPRVDTSEGSSTGGPLCVLVFVGGNDFVTMPRDSPSAQSLFMKDFVSAHQALLSVIRHRRPNSAIVSLYGDADSCSGCQSVAEQRFISANMQEAIIRSVAGLGGAQFGFFSCLVQPNIRLQCPSDWSHDMHWGPTGHQKFATGLKEALLALALREGAGCKGEQPFPGMAALATMLSDAGAAAGRASEGVTSSAIRGSPAAVQEWLQGQDDLV
mmetsp:Transcript_37349/g.87452  ORF Transcript_37349/g.87452 Transcript_37349/m.87452 type:complete len:441 (+) Transcript_37349:83-1405(+)